MRHILGLLLLFLVSAASVAQAEVDESPLPIAAVKAFPNLKFRRPIVLTHADDGTDRVFVASQLGTIHVFPNDQQVEETGLFLDIEKKVVYADKQNEEGLLGFAFHPKFKENGQFFLYYTTKDGPPHTSVISRFRVSKNNPNIADPASEEEIMRIPQPYWNHNGGTLAFGPDGYLYIGLGDGGKANDPHGNGQNLETWLGSILRIDVDRKDQGKGYAVPKDNPFVGRKNAQPEIWAYGLRNVWRLAFDRKTGDMWAADVGQDLWEEINIITKGGNYGWNLREGMHPFPPNRKPSAAEKDLIDPIWEYHHDVGKSVTGGDVYRGKRVPALDGMYVYADYVTGKLYALKYDDKQKKVTANRTIGGNVMPVMSFGQDQSGELYFMTDVGNILWFESTEK